jgi:hypothetical protein
MEPVETSSLQVLHTLTALTYLGLGSDFGVDDWKFSLPGADAGLTPALPVAWQQGLQHLRWLHSDCINTDALRLLTSLTCLEFSRLHASAELAWCGPAPSLTCRHLALYHRKPVLVHVTTTMQHAWVISGVGK